RAAAAGLRDGLHRVGGRLCCWSGGHAHDLHIPIDRSCGIGSSGGAALLVRAAGGGVLTRLVLVVALDPTHAVLFVPALGGQIEEVVRADQDVAAARVAGIGVEHLALVVPV